MCIHACLIYSVTGLIIQSQDVAVVHSEVDSNGNPIVSIYVQFNSSAFLLQASLTAAVMMVCSHAAHEYELVSIHVDGLSMHLFFSGILRVRVV